MKGTRGAQSAVRALVAGLVDYAGLYPPASCSVEEAAREYARARRSDEAWMLGRFVCGPAHLDAVATAAREHGARAEAPWSIALVAGDDVETAARDAARYRHGGEAVVVSVVELKARTAENIAHIARRAPADVDVYVELPLDPDPRPLVAALGTHGLRAKGRTGGIKAEDVPDAGRLARFIVACAELGVPYKVTAGLHHPLCGVYPLAYGPTAPRARMFGFLSVLLGAAAAASGADARRVTELVGLEDLRDVDITDRGVWLGPTLLPTTALADVRRTGLVSIGSCSFREPADELPAAIGGAK